MQVFCLSRSSESLSLQHGGFVLSVCEHSYQRRLVLKDNKHIKNKDTAVYVGSSVKVHNPLFSVSKL